MVTFVSSDTVFGESWSIEVNLNSNFAQADYHVHLKEAYPLPTFACTNKRLNIPLTLQTTCIHSILDLHNN